jgi:hypothetical protein
MPLHDWTRVDAGLFHAFHLQWIVALTDSLNAGILPADYYALPERNSDRHWNTENCTEEDVHARKACHVAIHDSNQAVVSVIEIQPAKIRLLVESYNSLPSNAVEEPIRIGKPLPAMSLSLKPDSSVQLPLEATYQTAWRSFPRHLKPLLE